MPTRRFPLALAMGAILFSTAVFAKDKPAQKKPAATAEITVDGLKLTVPTAWKKTKPTSRMRKGQFNIPAVKGDADAAEYVIFQFGAGGGGIDANIKRWISQFPAKGRNYKITKGKCPQGQYVLVDITGAFNMPVGPPIQRKTKLLPNARMIGVILIMDTSKKVYFLKTTGGQKTVDANAKAIRAAIGADEENEEELILPGT